MESIKNTTLLQAVASSIQHEKDCFDFYLKAAEQVKSSDLKDFFNELAEDTEEHITLIQKMYSELSGGVAFPNLKELNAVHKFHKTPIAKMMKKVDKNINADYKDDLDTVSHALKISEDAREFCEKMKTKFTDPSIKRFFNKLAFIKEEERIMVESQHIFLQQKDKTKYYWEDESLLNS